MGIGVVASLASVAGLAASWMTGDQDAPPSAYSWRWWMFIGFFGLAAGMLVGAAERDWNAFIFPQPAMYVVGGVILIGGAVGFLSLLVDPSARPLFASGGEESSGRASELPTDGYYRYTRNPQILVLLVILVGIVLVANSLAVLLIAAAMGVSFVALAVVREQWLSQEYGEAYEAYCRTVPRFVGWRTLSELLQRDDEAT